MEDKTACVMVVDDHPIIRQGLAMLINREADLNVDCEAGSMQEALAVLRGKRPDVVIIDISMEGASGFELIRHIKNHHPDLPMLVVSMHDETLYAERALRAGARGYVMKQEATEKVLLALREILAGGIFVDDRIRARMEQRATEFTHDANTDPVSALSISELEVLRLIATGHGTSEISRKLHRSVKTIESHRANIRRKLFLQDGAELVQFAINWHRSG